MADGGPDIVQNGIALSATAHWLFDRHLISLDDDCRLLISHNKVPADLIRLFPQPGERVRLRLIRASIPTATMSPAIVRSSRISMDDRAGGADWHVDTPEQEAAARSIHDSLKASVSNS